MQSANDPTFQLNNIRRPSIAVADPGSSETVSLGWTRLILPEHLNEQWFNSAPSMIRTLPDFNDVNKYGSIEQFLSGSIRR